MSVFDWLISTTESGKKSHLTETGVYTFCAPLWGKVKESAPYEGQTRFKGKPMCITCEKAGTTRAAREIARQRGDEASSLWMLYQTANGRLTLRGKGTKPASDEPAMMQPRLRLVANGN